MNKPFDPNEPLDPTRALVPETVRVNEQKVVAGFWPKFRKVASRIPFAADVLSLYYAARDPETPASAKALMLAGLAYFIMPFDAIPDVMVGLGYTDDAAVIAALIALAGRNLKPRHKEAARKMLERFGS